MSSCLAGSPTRTLRGLQPVVMHWAALLSTLLPTSLPKLGGWEADTSWATALQVLRFLRARPRGLSESRHRGSIRPLGWTWN